MVAEFEKHCDHQMQMGRQENRIKRVDDALREASSLVGAPGLK